MSTWVHFSAGRGPAECRLAVEEMSAIFAKELNAVVIDTVEDRDGHGLLSILMSVEGDGYLPWCGTLEWICSSPLRNHGRKRWYVGVSAIKAVELTDTNIKPSDLRWEAMRASGPGGQHVNKTDSAVRLTHIPTGIVINAREERSQHRNRALAISKLAAMLKDGQVSMKANADKDIWEQHDDLIRGNPIKSFRGPKFSLS